MPLFSRAFLLACLPIDTAVVMDNELIHESSEEKLLGVTLDKTIFFKAQVTSVCKKANQNLHALSRIAH